MGFVEKELCQNFTRSFIILIFSIIVTDNGVGEHPKNHQYQPLAITRHQDKIESHKSTCAKQTSQVSPLAPVVTASSSEFYFTDEY